MAKQVAIDPKELSPSKERVARYLGGAGYQLSPKMQERVDKGIETAISMVTPRATYRVVTADQFQSAFNALFSSGESYPFPFDSGKLPTPYAAVFLASLGGELETAVRSLADRNRFYQSMLLDAAGTAMLDIMGRKLELLVDGEARRMGYYAGCRLGPGLNGTALENQSLLFKLLDGGTLDVRLNDSFIMEPAKTISAFVLFDVEDRQTGQGHKCSRCTLKDCQFRTKPQ